MQVKITIDSEEFIQLATYLLNHESDIAESMNDYGELVTLFKRIHGRQPAITLPGSLELSCGWEVKT